MAAHPYITACASSLAPLPNGRTARVRLSRRIRAWSARRRRSGCESPCPAGRKGRTA